MKVSREGAVFYRHTVMNLFMTRYLDHAVLVIPQWLLTQLLYGQGYNSI
jgi:hypothetical protein